MKVHLTMEEIRRPLGSDLPDEAKRFLDRVGSVNMGDDDDEGFGVPEGDPINWNELNQTGAEMDRCVVEAAPPAKR